MKDRIFMSGALGVRVTLTRKEHVMTILCEERTASGFVAFATLTQKPNEVYYRESGATVRLEGSVYSTGATLICELWFIRLDSGSRQPFEFYGDGRDNQGLVSRGSAWERLEAVA